MRTLGRPRNSMKSITALLATGLAAAAFIAPARTAEKDIVDTAIAAGKFNTLVSLVKQADLVSTLKGTGPFTVLAPTDAAFKKLPKSLVAKLMGDKELLKKVLTYHVIPGNIMSTDLKTMSAATVEGESIAVAIRGKNVRFNNAKPVMVDVKASNGVIHAIDTVLLPPSVAKMMRGKMKGGMMKKNGR